ncbi:MAG TPA: cytochrome ubiquinol oxidase subunit I [Tepidisphaeraceae bacterium]|nr:cytochrome ubiquinol oxidase subunit I [Tepidisphaeraceae bacterium]
MDTLTAARWQMALSLAFHMVFAAVGIGLPFMLVIVEAAHLRTGRPHYKRLAQKWAKVTGLLFAIGAVSGTALSFELGLLWPRYMKIMGPVVGHLFALEGYAFFVEAIFIGLYLYGWDKLSPRGHWLCGVVVAISGALSGWFVLGVNAWMQVPVGFTRDAAGAVTVTDPRAIFKQAGWVYMAVHSTLSCYISVGFAVAGVYAAGWLRGKRDDYHRAAIVTGMAVGGICALAQPLSGDLLAKFVFRTQPAKFAAMEGQFKTEPRAPLRIGGWPNVEEGRTDLALEIPGGLSFLAAHDSSAVVPGLESIPRDRWPNVHLTHAMFQVMVGLGTLLMLLTVWFWWTWWRRRGGGALENRWLLRAVLAAAPMGFVALEAGWMVTEVGRQPWVINGVMLTRDAVTPVGSVGPMFVGFTLLYVVLAATTIVLLRALRSDDTDPAPQDVPAATPAMAAVPS